ncbi:MAG: succinyl-diaminopimelate desuccinylase [Parvibaculales bacterium]
MPINPVSFAADLIRCPSVTPRDAGALDVLQQALETLGFDCTRLPFEEDGTARVDNLYARYGSGAPHFCFAGHTDVVPVGDAEAWQEDPFAGTIKDGALWGRGAADMKGAIAAFVAAAERVIANTPIKGSISLLITGDEEGPSVNGTIKMLKWLEEQGQTIDDCLVGEPTNPKQMGDMVKIGRRGSVNGVVTVTGKQGHVAYPDRADNPVPHLMRLMNALQNTPIDEGSEHFQPSNLEVTSFDVGNATTNVIPAIAQARFNIRYNDLWTRDTISNWIEETLESQRDDCDMRLELIHSGESFLTETGPLTDMIAQAIHDVTGREADLSTTGGTSDARFISKYCRVVEFGLVGQTMHQVDEHVQTSDIETLTEIYNRILGAYFAA